MKTRAGMLLILLVVHSLLLKGCVPQITASGDTTALYGRDAHYRCTASGLTGVRQVTWLRRLPDGSMENLATYSHRFGQQVNKPYQGKVQISEVALNATAITLHGATWEDEACYVCSFNTYPGGSVDKETCLTVKGLSSSLNVSFSVLPANRSREVTFRCSATGRPLPVLSWSFTPEVVAATAAVSGPAHNDTELRLPDGSSTALSTVTVSAPRQGWDGYATCSANAGMEGERTERIHICLGEEVEEGIFDARVPSPIKWIVIGLGLITYIIVFAICCYRSRSEQGIQLRDFNTSY